MVPHESRMRLLVVDSNQRDVDLVCRQLERVWTIVHATALSDGLKRLSSETFDAVLLDLDLPDSSGMATYSAIREEAPGMPVVVLSSHPDVGSQQTADELPFVLDKKRISSGFLEQLVRYAAQCQ